MIFSLQILSHMWWIMIIELQIIIVLPISRMIMSKFKKKVSKNQRHNLPYHSTSLPSVNRINNNSPKQHSKLH
jgi:hypothetical protein